MAVLVGLAGCLPAPVPPSPNIEVVVTVVDQAALGDAVAQALTATASSGVALTETALAAAGITLTPTPTPTATVTLPPPTETPYVPPTPTPTPLPSATPTITPLPTNTPLAEVESVNGQIRVVHAWRSPDSTPVDVFINDLPIALGLDIGDATTYQSIGEPRTARITLIPPAYRTFDQTQGGDVVIRQAPLVDILVDVPVGSSFTVALVDLSGRPEGLIIPENMAPLATGEARVTLVQANPNLIRVDAQEPLRDVVLARNMQPGSIVGAFDVKSGNMALQLLDTEFPDQILVTLSGLPLNTNTHYLLILVPGLDFRRLNFATEMLVFASGTRLTPADTPVRFVNAAPKAGPITILYQGNFIVTGLGVGEMTVPLPVSRQQGSLTVLNASDQGLLTIPLGDWTRPHDEKIIVISDLPEALINREIDQPTTVELRVFEREPRSSRALANLRLIHALTGATQTLDLEIRATDPRRIDNPIGIPLAAQTDLNWSRIVRNISFGEASDYVTRASNIFDLRVSLSSTGGVQASLDRLPLLPGGTYDVLVVPGPGVGVTRLLVLEPSPQVTILGTRQGDPEVIAEIVAATLTAAAPNAVTATLAAPQSPTPTISPVPTNTPRPSSTPRVSVPTVSVYPAPPNAVAANGILIVQGQHFAPNTRYTININSEPTLLSGSVGPEGDIALPVTLPGQLPPGPHVIRVCADCREGGAQQEALAVFIVADPRITPSATPQP
jgi:hypothetical protein